MPLQEQVLDVPIVGGLQQQEDSRLTAAPRTMKNCRYKKGGSVSKRKGYTFLCSSSGTSLHTQKNALVPYSPSAGVGSYSPTLLSATIIADKNHFALTSIEYTGKNRVTDGDIVYSYGYRVAFWAESTSSSGATTGLYYSVTDDTSGEVVVQRTVLTDVGNQPQLAVISATTIYLIYNLSTDIKYVSLSLSAPQTAVSAPSTLVSNVLNGVKNIHHDASFAGEWILAWQDVAGTLKVSRMSFSSAVATATLTTTGLVNVTSVAVHYDKTNSKVWIAYDGVDGAAAAHQYYQVYTSSTMVVALSQTDITSVYFSLSALMRGVVATSSTTATILASSNTGLLYGWWQVTSAGVVSASFKKLSYAGIHFISRPVVDSGGFVYVLCSTFGQGNTYVWASVSSTNILKPISTFFPALSNGDTLAATAGSVVQPPAVSVMVYADKYKVGFVAPKDASDANFINSLVLATMYISPNITTAQWGDSLFFSGGMPYEYDGASIYEIAPIGAPHTIATAADATAGNLANAPYYYSLVPTIISKTGLLHLGTPSQISTTTPVVNKSIMVYAPIFATTKTASGPFYQIYRTLDTPGNYYRAHTDVALPDMTNDISALSLDYVDGVASTAIDENPLLYTTGGILPNIQPPSSRLIHKWGGRMWLADSNDGFIWYSKTLVVGECPSFTLAFTLPPLEAGRVTGLSSFEDKLVVFYETSIWAIFGDGPGDTGVGGVFSSQRIVDGLGCTDNRSIVQTPAGIMFQDASGIHMIARDLTTNRIGMAIEDTMETYSEVTSAVYLPTDKEARFSLVEGTHSLIAVYDFESAAWSLDELNDGYTDYAIVSAVLYQDKYTYLKSNGFIFQESSSSYLDGSTSIVAGNFVTMTFETGEIHVNQIQGMQRVWEAYALTKRHSAHGLTLTFYNDYSSNSSQSETFTEAVVTTAGTVGQFGVTLLEQECQSLRIRVTDAAPATLGTGQGCTITGITLCIGSEGKITKRVHTDQRK